MGTREEAASNKEDGETGPTLERRSKHAQWDALDRPQRSAVAGIAGGVWPWQSVYARFAKWRDDGTLEAIFRALSADADMQNLSLDSTCIKVHESANGGEKNGR
jgi:transposase